MSKVIIDGPGTYVLDDGKTAKVEYFFGKHWCGNAGGEFSFWTPEGVHDESRLSHGLNVVAKCATHAMAGGEFLEPVGGGT